MKPWDLRALVWNREWDSATELLVMLVLAEHADGEHSSFPSQDTIATCARTSVRTTKRILANLEERGVLSRSQRWVEGRRRSNLYHLHVDTIEALPVTANVEANLAPSLGDNLAPSPDLGAKTPEARGQIGEAAGQGRAYSGQEHSLRTPNSEPKDARLVSFDAFWSVYPLKRDKGAAKKAWPKAVRLAGGPDAIILGAERFASDPNRVDQFTPYPATWLNGERWDDPPLPSRLSAKNGRRADERHATTGRALARLRSLPT